MAGIVIWNTNQSICVYLRWGGGVWKELREKILFLVYCSHCLFFFSPLSLEFLPLIIASILDAFCSCLRVSFLQRIHAGCGYLGKLRCLHHYLVFINRLTMMVAVMFACLFPADVKNSRLVSRWRMRCLVLLAFACSLKLFMCSTESQMMDSIRMW